MFRTNDFIAPSETVSLMLMRHKAPVEGAFAWSAPQG